LLKFGQAFQSLRGAGAEPRSLTEQIIVEKQITLSETRQTSNSKQQKHFSK